MHIIHGGFNHDSITRLVNFIINYSCMLVVYLLHFRFKSAIPYLSPLLVIIQSITWTVSFQIYLMKVDENGGKAEYDFTNYSRIHEILVAKFAMQSSLFAPTFRFFVFGQVPAYLVGVMIFNLYIGDVIKERVNDELFNESKLAE